MRLKMHENGKNKSKTAESLNILDPAVPFHDLLEIGL